MTWARTGPSTQRKSDSRFDVGNRRTWRHQDLTAQPVPPQAPDTHPHLPIQPLLSLHRRSSVAGGATDSLTGPETDRTWTVPCRRKSESRTTCDRRTWTLAVKVHSSRRGVQVRWVEVRLTSPTAVPLWSIPRTVKSADGWCITARDLRPPRLTSSTAAARSSRPLQVPTVKSLHLMQRLPLQTCKSTSAMQRTTWFSLSRLWMRTSGVCTRPSSPRTTASIDVITTTLRESQGNLLNSKISWNRKWKARTIGRWANRWSGKFYLFCCSNCVAWLETTKNKLKVVADGLRFFKKLASYSVFLGIHDTHNKSVLFQHTIATLLYNLFIRRLFVWNNISG